VTGRLLHSDAEDNKLFNANHGDLKNCVADAAKVVAAVPCLEHLGLLILKGMKSFHVTLERRRLCRIATRNPFLCLKESAIDID